MKYLSLELSGVAATLCLAAAVPAMASTAYPTTTFQNGSFDQGVDGFLHWQTFGDASVIGVYDTAVVTTASVAFPDDDPLPKGFRNRSGVPAVDLTVVPYLAGIPVTGLDIGGIASEGSAIRQDFVATGGNIVTVAFDWIFLTSEPSTVTADGMPDFGFLALNGSVFPIFQNIDGAQVVRGRFEHTFVETAGQLTAFPGSTLYTVRPGGHVSLVLGAVDMGDFDVTSELHVDNFTISAVPEPEAFAMLAAGLGLIGWKLRRRQQAQREAAA
jgi:hypothetical protein